MNATKNGKHWRSWLWRIWLAAPVVMLGCTLAIGYARNNTSSALFAWSDTCELANGVCCVLLVDLPLFGLASFVCKRGMREPWRNAVLVGLALSSWFLGLFAFLYYQFGPVGMAMRGWAIALFERR